MRFALITTLLAACHATTAAPVEPPAQQAADDPAIQKMDYYVGHWEGEGEAKEGPFGPAGKLSSTTTCEWFAGGHHLVCRGEERGPTGTRTFLSIRAYDAATQTYTEYGISSLGDTEYQTGGTMEGNQRSFTFDTEVEGKPLALRYVEVQESPTVFTYKAEASVDGGPWTEIAVGRVTKVE